MADAVVQVVDNRAVVQFSGPEAINALVAEAVAAVAGAQAVVAGKANADLSNVAPQVARNRLGFYSFNIKEVCPGENISAETDALISLIALINEKTVFIYVPKGSTVFINKTVPKTGLLRFYGGGTIVLVAVNGPAFECTLVESVEHVDLGDVHFVNQAVPGQPYDQSCALRIVSTDPNVYCTYNNFDDISGQGFHSLIRIAVATRTTSFGQESNFAWNRFSRLTPTAGVNLARYGVLMEKGSGTGNTFADFTTALYDTSGVSAAVRVEGAGCVCGDIVFTGGHHGGSGAKLSFGAGMAYRRNITISTSQADAGLTKICHWDDPSEVWTDLDIEVNNIGGGVTQTVWPFLRGSVIREVSAGRWEASRTGKTPGAGPKSVNLYSLTYAPREDGEPAGGIVEVHAGAEVAGVGYDSVWAKYMVTVTGGAVEVKIVDGPINQGGPLLTLSPFVSGYNVTFNLAYTTSGEGGDYESNIIARGGTLKITKP